MAVRISSSKFLSTPAAKSATLSGLDDPLPVSGGPLPAPIRNGVAKLVDIWFEEDPVNGESFRAEAVVVFPEIALGGYIKGKKTKQWISFNDQNIEDRIPRIRDVLKGLAGREVFGSGRDIDYIKIVNLIAANAKKSPGIYFGFSTSVKEGSDWPWENWHQSIPNFKEPSSLPPNNSETQKKTGYSNNGQSVSQSVGQLSDSVAASTDSAPWSSVQSNGVGPVADTNTYSDTDDLSSLIRRAADSQDNFAMDKLDKWAKELGYTQEDLDDAPNYRVIGDWVISGKRKDEDKDKPTDLGTPVVSTKPKRTINEGQVYTYAPPNKRGDGPRRKECECRVTAIDNVRETATLQNLSNKSEVFEVSWSDENLK